MEAAIRRVTSSTFVRYNAIAFIGSVAVAALNYLYYPVIGRLLNPADYGEVQAITSIYIQAIVFMSVFNIVIISVLNKYEDKDTQNRLIAELEKAAIIITSVTILVLLFASSGISVFFRFGSVYPLLLLLIALGLSVPSTFRLAFLQGNRRFGPPAISGAISAGGKLLLGTALVLIGWQAFGAVLGTVLAQALTLGFLVWSARRIGWIRPADFKRVSLPDLKLIRPELYFASLVLITTICFNLFLSLDILAVKHWFAPTIAGLYGGIETLSRIVFYISISVAGVLLPTVSTLRTAKENRETFFRSLLLTTCLGLSVLLVFLLFPVQIVTLLMGRKFLVFVGLLPYLGFYTFLASLINLVNMYFLAQRQWFIALASGLGLAATLLILVARHGTPFAVVTSLIAGAFTTLVLVGAIAWLWPKVKELGGLTRLATK